VSRAHRNLVSVMCCVIVTFIIVLGCELISHQAGQRATKSHTRTTHAAETRRDETIAIASRLQSKSNLSLPRIWEKSWSAADNCFLVEGFLGLMGILLFRLRGVN